MRSEAAVDEKKPGGVAVAEVNSASFEDDLRTILSLAGRPAGSAEELAGTLRQIYGAVYGVDLNRYDAARVKSAAPQLMTAIFEARLALRDRIPEWSQKGFMTDEVQSALRDVFRAARYGADMLGEIAIGNHRFGDTDRRLRAFSGTDHNTFVNPRHATGGNIPFQSGDVLVVRGTAHNSAAIARIGTADSQFSHAAIIYVDRDGEPWVVEALIEDGAVIHSLVDALSHNVGRAVLYRHSDPGLAARAASHIHGFVRATHGRRGRAIPYDFSMRLEGKKKLFCSKLVHLAFKEASAGKVKIPAYMTRLDMKNRDFFQRIGVKAKSTFAPGDLDLDPAFDLIAEWQDYRRTSGLRRQDMIMTKVFEWMEAHGYRFEESLWIRLLAIFGRITSRFSDELKKLISSVVPKVPSHMPGRTIATVIMLHKTAEELMPPLAALEDDQIRMTGRPLHSRDVLLHLERLREVSGGRIGYLAGRS